METKIRNTNLVEACAVVLTKEENRQYLIAYVVANQDFDQAALKIVLQQNLPDYMLPTVFIKLAQLPLNASGKLDRKALPTIDLAALKTKTYLSPRNTTEKVLVRIWEDLLQLSPIGIQDNFFELGGHSLLATKVVAAIEQNLQKSIGIKTFFDHATIASLADHLQTSTEKVIVPTLRSVLRPQHIPLSFSQERLWFIDQLQGSTNYHIPYLEKIDANINRAFLAKAFQRLINRHEILRTVYYSVDGQAYQKVLAKDQWQLNSEKRSKFKNEKEKQAVLVELGSQAFDLSQAHTLRANLLEFPDGTGLLLVVLHHIAADGWSSPIFLRELLACYEAIAAEKIDTLPALPVQYADFALWQRAFLSEEALAQKLGYWETQLEEVAPLDLPTDFPRPQLQSIRGGTKSIVLPQALTAKMLSIAQDAEVTTFMFCLSVLKILLHKYTGQTDITVGSPVANRRPAGVENLIGLFVNTLALRSDLSGNPSFSELLTQLRTTTLTAYEHQDVPFEKIVDRVVPQRDRSRSPLFQVFLSYEAIGKTASRLFPKLSSVDQVPSETSIAIPTSKFDLSFHFQQNSKEITLNISYCSDLFLPATIERMMGHYQNLLSAAVQQPQIKLAALTMLSSEERQKIQFDFNDTTVPYDETQDLLALFTKEVILQPNAIAVSQVDQELSYKALDEQSNQFAYYLAKKTALKGALIAVCMNREINLLVVLWGILKSGNTYVPLDPNYPKERIDYIIADAKVALTICDQPNVALLGKQAAADGLVFEKLKTRLTALPKLRLALEIAKEQTAYIIYTSGSTGEPKGVMISHRNLQAFLHWAIAEFSESSFEVVFAATSICFDLSIFELYYTLCAGKRIRLLKDASNIPSYLTKEKSILLNTVPSVVKTLLQTQADLSKVTVLNMAGEVIPPYVQNKLNFEQIELRNLYGPSEDTTYSTIHRLQKEERILIGRPIQNTQVYIVDQALNLLPVGGKGELCLGGAGVAKGYLYRPALTEQKFLPNPFDVGNAPVLYRTGDFARWLPDGTIDFLGRMDSQVKLRGYRIELDEVALALKRHTLIQDAIALIQTDETGYEKLVAYATTEATTTAAQIQADLKTKLPTYLVPAVIIFLDAFPLTPNGKIDKNALPALLNSVDNETVNPPLQGETEIMVAKIWSTLLRKSDFGREDDFFELGGHSLLAMRVVAALQKELAVTVEVKDVFAYPTIAGLAAFLREESSAIEISTITSRPRPGKIPLSYSQERLWFVDELTGSLPYHLPSVYRLQGTVQPRILAEAFRSLLRRHEILRTTYHLEKGEIHQKIQPVATVENWSLVTKSITNDSASIENQLRTALDRPFDLTKDFMLSANLYQVAEEEFILLLVVHHIASDGWSSSIIVKEMLAFYKALKNRNPAVLSPLPIQYADYALWQRTYLQEQVLAQKLDFWEKQLVNAATLKLPTDFPHPKKRSNRGNHVDFIIGEALTAKIKALGQQEGMSLFMVLLAAFKIVLHRYSGQKDICIGVPVANRGQVILDDLIGFFVNIIVIRSTLTQTMTVQEVLSQVKATSLAAFQHQDAPFEKVISKLATQPDATRHPLIQAAFGLQNNETGPAIILDDFVVKAEKIDRQFSKFDLNVSIVEKERSLLLDVEYSTDLFLPTTIDNLFQHYENLLTALVAQPNRPIGALKLLSVTEEKELLETFNATDFAYPHQQSIVEIFEAQVAAQPKHVALKIGADTMSYQELNAKANQLANHLKATYDLQLEDFVACLLPRSVEAIIAILAILKTGAAYVPISLEDPLDRKLFILTDTQAKVLLTNFEEIAKLGAINAPIFCIDVTLNLLETATGNLEDVQVHAAHLAYSMYTSGSTGKAKAVLTEHRAILRLIYNEHFEFLNQSTVLYQYAPLAFDAATFEIWGALLKGNTLCISNPGLKTLDDITTEINAGKVKVLWLTAGLFHQAVATKLSLFENLDFILSGGDSIQSSSIEQLLEAHPNLVFINGYGPTESTTFATLKRIDTVAEINHLANDIGKPISNTQAYILDSDRLTLLPKGVVGELCLSGDGLARAYLNQAALTEEKFVAHPFIDGKRIYRTGDLARWLPNGNIDFVGRNDRQIKLRGYRIELAEIETTLETCTLVRQAVVLTKSKENERTVEQLAAYLLPENTTERSSFLAKVQLYLKERLPNYMLPSQIVVVEELPLTKNGKIDYQALQKLTTLRNEEKIFIAPRTEFELQLVELWKTVVGLDRLSVLDNFFEIGGHSLLAIKLVSQIRDTFQLEVGIEDLFNHPTVESLAKLLETEPSQNLLSVFSVEERPATIPLSFAQERLWFVDQLQGSVAYHIPLILSLQGKLNQVALANAFSALIARHEILRTRIVNKPEHLVQEVCAAKDWQMALLREADLAVAIEEYIESFIDTAFNLSEDFPLRVNLIERQKENQFVLAIVVHHIASDAWSIPIFMEEFKGLYDNYCRNQTPKLPDLTAQYADYAIWQRKIAAQGLFTTQLAYWKEQLRASKNLAFPTDYTRPAEQSLMGATVQITIDQALLIKLQTLAERQSVTLFTLLLTSFKALLYKYTRQDDILVGVPVAGRTTQAVEGLIGFFVNMLALRTQITEEISFVDLLQEVKQTTLSAYANQMVPFEQVVDALQVPRDRSRTPLVQVYFNFLKETPSFALPAMEVQDFFGETKYAKTDLNIAIVERADSLEVGLIYCTALFDASTMQALLDHYKTLLSQLTEDPAITIDQLKLLTATQAQELLQITQAEKVNYPKDKTIVDLFAAQVARTPNHLALSFAEGTMTYRRLDDLSNQLANYLLEKSVAPESLIGICLAPSFEMIVSILGVIKAGAAYVPIDPTYPEERIQYTIADAGVKIVLGNATSPSRLQNEKNLEFVKVGSDWKTLETYATSAPNIRISPSHLLYVIYTSGSTGKPKGVLLEHQNLVRLFHHDQNLFDFKESDVWTLFHSFCFDFSVWEMYGALLFGGRLVILPKEITKDPVAFSSLLVKESVTVLNQTPGAFYVLEEALRASGAKHHLRYVVFGGEALQPAKLSAWKKDDPTCRLINMYGITETTVHVTFKEITLLEIEENSKSIGKAIPTLNCYILDAGLNLCPVKMAGELHVAGAGLARGYLHRSALTQEKFIPHPFSNEPDARLYKTGDLARWLPNGEIEYLGRVDEQVKIRGYRIELGEITSVVETSPMILRAVVLAQLLTQDIAESKQLVVYYIPADDFDRDHLIQYLEEKLPDYMIPQKFVAIAEIPLTINGKLDKQALPSLANELSRPKVVVAARNETERVLVQLWQTLLGIKVLGIKDNFFEIGGHSLLAARVVTAIREQLQRAISIKDIFTYPTIALLSERLKVLATVDDSKILSEPRPAQIPLSYAQERLWIIDQLGGSEQYHIPYVLKIKGSVDLSIITTALQMIIERHEILRTVYKNNNEAKGYQEIRSAADWELTVQELGTAEAEKDLIEKLIHQAFDLSVDFSLRASIIRRSEKTQFLVLVLHHIAADGWSLSILVEEFLAIVAALEEGLPVNLAPLPIQYADYAIWQKSYLVGEAFDASLQYWENQLAGVESLQLPLDFTRPKQLTTTGENLNFTINKKLSKQLENLALQENVSLFMLLLAGYKVLLYRYTDQQDISVGTPIANRKQSQLEPLIGFFLNTLVLRTEVTGQASFASFLQAVKATSLAAFDHQEIPFEELVERIPQPRGLHQSPLFQVMFVFQNNPTVPELQLEHTEITVEPTTYNVAKYELTFNVAPTPAGIRVNIEYATDLFLPTSIHRMMGHYERLLQSIVNQLDQPIAELPMLTSAETSQIFTEFKGKSKKLPAGITVIDEFENQVIAKPKQVALAFAQKTLSYQQLNTKVNQLANYLRKQGVGSQTLVGVVLERSFEMIISVLAILKTGAAYVPIDPEYPADRIAYILENAETNFVISQHAYQNKVEDTEKRKCFLLEELEETIAGESTDNLALSIDPESLMYVIYTSGSTGKPKGVMVRHFGIINLVVSQIETFGITETDRVLQFASLSFDASVSEIFTSLYSGACLVLIDKTTILQSDKFITYLKTERVNIATLPPAYLNVLDLSQLKFMKTIVSAGEAIDKKQALYCAQFLERFINGYGPTETSVCAAMYQVDPMTDAQRTLPIGKAIANTSIYLLDDHLQLVPINKVGEICVTGISLAMGYWKNEKLTQEKFIPNPFAPQEKMYRTGDLGKWLPDGNILYLGRKDNQIKINGYRIELGEIEEILQEQSAVEQAVVIAKTIQGQKELVAYLLAPESLDYFMLRKKLAQQLPNYMVPARYVSLTSFPLTPNGKVDHQALANRKVEKMETGIDYIAPRNDLEKQLCALWAKVLNLDQNQISIEENFFDLGGNSIKMIQMNQQLKAELDIEMTVVALFEHSSIRLISDFLQGAAPSETDHEDAVDLFEQNLNLFNED
ncbi:MAG: amino acid adenylation domain-containing protein [Saprospiraceae bacterium]